MECVFSKLNANASEFVPSPKGNPRLVITPPPPSSPPLFRPVDEEASQKIINQVEYYFSDVNLATIDHLIKFINKDHVGYVPISVVASFKKIKAFISTNSQLAVVLRNSEKLVVSDDGKKVKRLHSLTASDMEELQARIIVAEYRTFVAANVQHARTKRAKGSCQGFNALSSDGKEDQHRISHVA
ncbi:hypothetical protein Dimus_015135 [Dionaea muscipula]